MSKRNILIIGSGSREHALAWKLSQSPKVGKIYIAPGNPGTAKLGENVNIEAENIPDLLSFAKNNDIYLTVVGPEGPLCLGIVDEFEKNNLRIWGPHKLASQIESSKAFAKDLMKKAGVPTAEFQTFTDYTLAQKYLRERGVPIVIKASGLAFGKGVIIPETMDEAEETLKKIMLDKIFGDSGSEVVIEEFLEGPEFSAHAFTDGKDFKLLPSAQDHKRIYDEDKGPNTGGVGTIAPLPWVTEKDMQFVGEKIVAPILQALSLNAVPFVGVLYPGLIMTEKGIKVIEFNCRFGGPECESYMRLLRTDLFDIMEACINGNLREIGIIWDNFSTCFIVACSKGYPDKYEKGKEITGIEKAEIYPNVLVFQSGTKEARGKLLTDGGRVLGVSAIGSNLEEALAIGYEAMDQIKFEGIHYRKDIGQRTLKL
jgi:phosphoribosylamine---glycine ligase